MVGRTFEQTSHKRGEKKWKYIHVTYLIAEKKNNLSTQIITHRFENEYMPSTEKSELSFPQHGSSLEDTIANVSEKQIDVSAVLTLIIFFVG